MKSTEPATADVASLMSAALSAARRAERLGEVPIGAIVVIGGEIIARGHNETIRAHDPTAHAEILAIRRAARKLGTHRLVDAELHVTLEPCAMCVGAMIQARIRALHFACRDPKAGAVVSVHQLASDRRLNHRIPLIREGALAEECRTLLQSFFRARRAEQR